MSDSPLGRHSNFSALNKPEVQRIMHRNFSGSRARFHFNDGTLASTIALDDSWTCTLLIFSLTSIHVFYASSKTQGVT
ncbi:hypothetical protein PAAG_05491 [Paracoccidioides lutzii Pb01]|uniref:Uncharacterized protein n=1 Tax=Paracoccidioides lutzii (strain ATCC MYA-826 / Pb01) TaxID=502779 RepID=C1H3Z8_PARBA|nr:hypothetical protein PAAG_05491 [Paracoccidioides lutzii Pb01]EEH34442.2 hypothetical protein PAAG_05491 [Paracoccidioides lutzii Pb01]